MIRKLLSLLTLLLLLPAVVFSYTIDLKTPLGEKRVLAPLKVGTAYYLIQAEHLVLEISEDYAVWLKDYWSTTADGVTRIDLTVKVTEPTAWNEKPALAERRVTFSYTMAEVETMTVEESFAKFLRKKLERYSERAKHEAQVGGKLVSDTIEELLQSIADTH